MKGVIFWQPEEYAPYVDVTDDVLQMWDVCSNILLAGDADEREEAVAEVYDVAEKVARLGDLFDLGRWRELKTGIRTRRQTEEEMKFAELMQPGIPHQHRYEEATLGAPVDTCQLPACNVRKGSPLAQAHAHFRAAWYYGGEHVHTYSSLGICLWPKCDAEMERADV